MVAPFLNKILVSCDEVEKLTDNGKSNLTRLITNETVGGQTKGVDATNHEVLASVILSMNGKVPNLHKDRTAEGNEERSLYVALGWDEVSKNMSVDEFAVWKRDSVEPALIELRRVIERPGVDEFSRAGLCHYTHFFAAMEFDPASVLKKDIYVLQPFARIGDQ